MKIAITGKGSLAGAARECCGRHFVVLEIGDPEIEVLWICHDTPIDPVTGPDYGWLVGTIHSDLSKLESKPVIIISSQIQVGTMATLEKMWPQFEFACSPENIRVASAVSDFENQARIIVGMRKQDRMATITQLLSPFTKRIIWMTPESAEMSKHALNCFLGLQIAFINEIASVCGAVGAEAFAVSQSLLSERRISQNAPLKPGKPFGLGHLQRDILTLEEIATKHKLSLPIITSIRKSNER